MIEVIIIDHGTRQDSAEAETPEGALLAGRTLWDEYMEYKNAYGARHGVSVLFLVDGVLSFSVESRRP